MHRDLWEIKRLYNPGFGTKAGPSPKPPLNHSCDLPPLLFLLFLLFLLEHTMSATAVPEKAPDDSSKLKTFLSILRKYAALAPHSPPHRGAAYRIPRR